MPNKTQAFWKAAQTRTAVFLLQLVVLCALLSVGALYLVGAFSLPNNLGSVPLAVPWFGALGAVAISLTGTWEHAKDWDANYAFWHWSRPFIGATLAVVTVLILQGGILAVGTTPTTTGGAAAPRNLLYYVVAFAVGYREETFRTLLKRLLDVLLSTGSQADGATRAVLSLAPPSGPVAGDTKVGITGAGFASVQAVKFGAQEAQFTVDSDHHLTATSPKADAAGPVTITVRLQDGSLTGPPFTYQ